MTDLSTSPEATRRACRQQVSKQERIYQTKDGGLLSVEVTSEHFYLASRAVHIVAIRDIADEKHDLYSDLKEIQTAAKRSADITKQLLAFARKQTISHRQQDLNDTVESMLNMLRRFIGENIDLLMTDVVMPEMNGRDLAENFQGHLFWDINTIQNLIFSKGIGT